MVVILACGAACHRPVRVVRARHRTALRPLAVGVLANDADAGWRMVMPTAAGRARIGSARQSPAASLGFVRVVVSALRGYWSAALLGLAALVLLALGAPAKAALAGAGFAFAGAAVIRGLDIAREQDVN